MTNISNNATSLHNNQTQTNFPFERGDVFFVKDSKGKTFPHYVIHAGLKVLGNSNPSIVHAGIVINQNTTVELVGEGIRHFRPSDIDGEEVIILRFNDKSVSALAADLAYNFERTLVQARLDELQQKVTSPDTSRQAGDLKAISYAHVNAFISAMNKKCGMNPKQKNMLINLTKDFNLDKIENTLYCSQFVVLVYAMAYQILRDDANNTPPNQPLDCNLLYTNPSVLYDYLCQQTNNWEQISLKIAQQPGGDVILFRSTPSITNTNAQPQADGEESTQYGEDKHFNETLALFSIFSTARPQAKNPEHPVVTTFVNTPDQPASPRRPGA